MKSSNHLNRVIIIFITSILFSGCEFLNLKNKENPTEGRRALARVDDTYLFEDELEGLFPNSISADDSAGLTQRYVNTWVKKQLMIKEAASKIAFNEAELERKLLDYKYALMVYEYQKEYIQEQLSDAVTDEEIVQYYNDHKDNFILKQNIVRANFLKLDNKLRQRNQMERLLRSDKSSDKEKLKAESIRFANNYFLEDSTWINFDELAMNTPLINEPNKVGLLRGNKFIEVSDDNFTYYFKILQYKISDQESPLEFVKDEIRKIIINKRKVELAAKLENDVYNRAKENDDFEIFDEKD
ncbi:peptidyl-prolyl cis-trans isomerase [Penaeicola halotolerans]|uniref:peptidyl-prolyl cis-trans isomerase n=1 Tax=Penaeicola halotolerans TaxID=2793196 RepID=UPI001CF8C8E1|nr:peptidyl-prolyl cis-trans isomerase [Penaeicola halotolerans]